MEVFSPTPILAALFAAVFFLYRAWPRSTSLKGHLKQQPESPGAQTVLKESEFPENWLTDKDLFQLERRAIFSKSWLYLSHRNRFTKPGDYHSFEVAGFPIFLILGQDGEVRAFHNVCRHRAYTVTRKECGSSAVLACRYHGWSYNTTGRLIRAPHFDNVPGFDRAQNGLFAIRTLQSSAGFIFVNLEVDAPGMFETGSLDGFADRRGLTAQSRWIEGGTIEGAFNWKLAAYAERQFGPAKLESELARLVRTSLLARMMAYLGREGSEDSDFLLFPNASLHTIKGTRYWYSLSFHSATEQKTIVRYDLYCSQTDDKSVSQLVSRQLVAMVKERVQELEIQYQAHIKGSGSCADPRNSDTQREILQHLKSHAKLERMQGREVHPASRQPKMTARFEQADQICRELECPGDRFQDLAW